MNFPEELRYTDEHEWVKIEGGTATMGITEFAQQQLGEIVFVDLPQPGKKLAKSNAICVVESTKAASDVYAPVGGTVKEVNGELAGSPELVNQDPYGRGWLVKLAEPVEADLSGLMSAAEYKKLVGDKA